MTAANPTHGAAGPRLVITPALKASRLPDGGVALTTKFIEGVREYARSWPGPITVLAESSERHSGNLDEVPVKGQELGFDLRIIRYRSPDLVNELRGAAVCLASTTFGQEHLSLVCGALGVPCVMTTENTLRTRVQIARASEPSALRRWRRVAWEIGEERRFRRAIRRADSLQCNGTPTFEAYRGLVRNPLLYFDTRVSGDMLARDADIAARVSDGPLRLVFSGRLVAIKGVDHLPHIAADLARRGVDFTMTICGDGPLTPPLRERVRALGLDSRVRFTGVLDFATQLVPLVRTECDLFVCCHRQGDPSCTYLETMSCGVPIAGYANEAMVGLARGSGSGWTVPLNDWRGMAALLERLSSARGEITEHARRALAFARGHTFNETFARRTAHLAGVARARGTLSP